MVTRNDVFLAQYVQFTSYGMSALRYITKLECALQGAAHCGAICHLAHISVDSNVHFTLPQLTCLIAKLSMLVVGCFVTTSLSCVVVLFRKTGQLSAPATLLPPVHTFTHCNFLYLSSHHNIVPCCFIFSLTLQYV